jgi:hypothetical protein
MNKQEGRHTLNCHSCERNLFLATLSATVTAINVCQVDLRTVV